MQSKPTCANLHFHPSLYLCFKTIAGRRWDCKEDNRLANERNGNKEIRHKKILSCFPVRNDNDYLMIYRREESNHSFYTEEDGRGLRLFGHKNIIKLPTINKMQNAQHMGMPLQFADILNR